MDDALLVDRGYPGAYLSEEPPYLALIKKAPGAAPVVEQHTQVAKVRMFDDQEEAPVFVAEGGEAFCHIRQMGFSINNFKLEWIGVTNIPDKPFLTFAIYKSNIFDNHSIHIII